MRCFDCPSISVTPLHGSPQSVPSAHLAQRLCRSTQSGIVDTNQKGCNEMNATVRTLALSLRGQAR